MNQALLHAKKTAEAPFRMLLFQEEMLGTRKRKDKKTDKKENGNGKKTLIHRGKEAPRTPFQFLCFVL